ncbi:MAG: hypothetical protein HUN04_20025 [Desulfobacter sp.]|nr:MAG: hypothetical protein HUN04_20025 [Desulfobacter sp.]
MMLGLRLAVLVFALFLVLPGGAGAVPWKVVKTRYLTLYYRYPSDIEQFDDCIEPVKHLAGFSSFSAGEPRTGRFGPLADKVDRLVEKVQLILDMRKPIRINVRLYPNKRDLHEAYFKLFRKRRQLRAWYLFERNTIYVNVKDLFSGMLAHEVAHAVIDNYMAARPPRATAEILARYVDGHLNEKAKVY